MWAPPGIGAMEGFSFPFHPDCVHCGGALMESDARCGTGLCKQCYENSVKDCSICKRRLRLKQLQWGSGLCKQCFNCCDKDCRLCKSSLALGQLHWGTGLCDGCYNSCQKICRMCSTRLQAGQLRWGTGLCDICYDSCPKKCGMCDSALQASAMVWGSGLCDSCYDSSEKTCNDCQSKIALGSLRWRSGLCDSCYDKRSKNCKFCKALLCRTQLHGLSGLCDACYGGCSRTCSKCQAQIGSGELHWGTGLCDGCYNTIEKTCKHCKKALSLGQLRWGSGLCDQCYTACEKTCRICESNLPLGQLHWGSRLCDNCFDACEKTCRECQRRIDIGQLRWGTGMCDQCYDDAFPKPAPGLSLKIKATIASQLIFYLAPAMLQPSLYIQIEASYGYDPSTVFAFVLTVASVVSMCLPVPLGIWAERRGEREVYCGVQLAATIAAAAFALSPPAPVFALCWAVMNAPPAVRGVRAAYFAKHVAPEELSRAGQLASSAGLAGGFLGPLISVALYVFFDGDNPETPRWPNSFVAASLLATAVGAICFVGLWWYIPPDKRKHRSGSSASHRLSERCERCCNQLTELQQSYANALCDSCYDSFSGENYSFGRFCRHVLVSFCIVGALLEVSMNAGVIATFQPIAVTQFGWGNNRIAAVNFAGAGLSVVVSLLMAHLRLPEKSQTAAAAGLYLAGVIVFTIPPLSEWKLVVGFMLGIKAQILFMAPFTAVFSRLIGRARVTNQRTTALCLAPAIGAALGTACAPAFVAVAGEPAFMLASLPALVAVVAIAFGWPYLEQRDLASRRAIRSSA